MFIFAEWLLLAEENPFCIDKKVPRGHLAEWQVFKKLIEFMHRAYMPPGMSSFVMTRPSMGESDSKKSIGRDRVERHLSPGQDPSGGFDESSHGADVARSAWRYWPKNRLLAGGTGSPVLCVLRCGYRDYLGVA